MHKASAIVPTHNHDAYLPECLDRPAFMEKLLRVISEEGVHERVIFAGERLESPRVAELVCRGHFVILPRYTEGLGKVLLEAQAMERPAVAYEVGGVTETIRH